MWYNANMPTLKEIKERAIPVLRANNATEAYLFGSVARGDAGADSDIDILANFAEPRGGLIEFIRAKHALEDALGKKVDLVEMSVLRKELRPYVDKDKVRLF